MTADLKRETDDGRPEEEKLKIYERASLMGTQVIPPAVRSPLRLPPIWELPGAHREEEKVGF